MYKILKLIITFGFKICRPIYLYEYIILIKMQHIFETKVITNERKSFFVFVIGKR